MIARFIEKTAPADMQRDKRISTNIRNEVFREMKVFAAQHDVTLAMMIEVGFELLKERANTEK